MYFMNKARLLALGATALTAATVVGTPGAQAATCSGVPVMIIADDESAQSVKGSSELFRRVTTELQDQMSRHGYCMQDQEFLEVATGADIPDRLPRTDKIRLLGDARALGDPRLAPRVVVFAGMFVSVEDLGFRKNLKIRVRGDMYNFKANAKIDGWEAPTQTFPVQDRNCSGSCLSEAAGLHARDIATVLGDVLREKLSHEVSVSSGTNGADGVEGKDQRLTNQILFTFRNFSGQELIKLTDVMEHEFPHTVKLDVTSGDRSLMRVNLVTRATERELFRWMTLLLAEDYKDGQIKLQVLGGDFLLDKLYGQPAQRGSTRKYD